MFALRSAFNDFRAEMEGFRRETCERLSRLEANMEAVQRDISGLKQDVSGLKQDVAELKQQMHTVLSILQELRSRL